MACEPLLLKHVISYIILIALIVSLVPAHSFYNYLTNLEMCSVSTIGELASLVSY